MTPTEKDDTKTDNHPNRRDFVRGVSVAGLCTGSTAFSNQALATQPKEEILVDASRDGGVWWSPQTPPFDPEKAHQGGPLADYLRSLGHSVEELPRSDDITIDLDTLRKYNIVIRANESGRSYSISEQDAYKEYVRNGNDLLLLSSFLKSDETDSLALSFGLNFQGISRGENIISEFADHPVAEGVSFVSYETGSGLTDHPSGTTIIGWLSDETFLDLNNDGEQDSDEPTGSPVLGSLRPGDGKIIFLGDTNTLQSVPQPLTENIIDWFLAQDETPTTQPPTTTATTQPPTTPNGDENGSFGILLPSLGAGSVGWLIGFFTGNPERGDIRRNFLNLLLVAFGSVGVLGLIRMFLGSGGAEIALLVTSFSWGLFGGLLLGIYLREKWDITISSKSEKRP